MQLGRTERSEYIQRLGTTRGEEKLVRADLVGVVELSSSGRELSRHKDLVRGAPEQRGWVRERGEKDRQTEEETENFSFSGEKGR